LVTWGATRTRNWPNVRTLKDIGIDIVSNSPFGIAGPKGMDAGVVKILHDAFRKGLEDHVYVAAMTQFDQEPFYLGRDDYRAFALAQTVEQKHLIEELHLGPQ
jgi:tripartite-type tricarboxylate transporter receptor subunit TctC